MAANDAENEGGLPDASVPDGAKGTGVCTVVEAFCSVHDMIHAAIRAYGSRATLREIYRQCIQQGRIAYKRSGGSRLITDNHHWKSQIRHALYTSDRFTRCQDDADYWSVALAHATTPPRLTRLKVEAPLALLSPPPGSLMPATPGKAVPLSHTATTANHAGSSSSSEASDDMQAPLRPLAKGKRSRCRRTSSSAWQAAAVLGEGSIDSGAADACDMMGSHGRQQVATSALLSVAELAGAWSSNLSGPSSDSVPMQSHVAGIWQLEQPCKRPRIGKLDGTAAMQGAVSVAATWQEAVERTSGHDSGTPAAFACDSRSGSNDPIMLAQQVQLLQVLQATPQCCNGAGYSSPQPPAHCAPPQLASPRSRRKAVHVQRSSADSSVLPQVQQAEGGDRTRTAERLTLPAHEGGSSDPPPSGSASTPPLGPTTPAAAAARNPRKALLAFAGPRAPRSVHVAATAR